MISDFQDQDDCGAGADKYERDIHTDGTHTHK